MTSSPGFDTEQRRAPTVPAPAHTVSRRLRPSWQSHLAHFAVRARMRPHALRPIDPVWVRSQTGRPRWLRRWLARLLGITVEAVARTDSCPGGEWLGVGSHRSPLSSPLPLRSHATSRQAAPSTALPQLGLSAEPVTVLYLHGGGYIACSPESHRPLVAALIRRLGAIAFVPAYRLAPEHPFPAALLDAIAAYRHLVTDCAVSPRRLVLAGDSAGGGLAIATALSLAEAGLPQPVAIVTFSPWTDLAATGGSLEENSNRCAMFAGDTIRRAARFYAGDSSPRDPRMSPLYGQFRGLAPLLLHVSNDEVLRDDSLRLAERAVAAGVTVELRTWSRVPHCWQFFDAVLPEARESLRAVEQFVARQLRNANAAPVTIT